IRLPAPPYLFSLLLRPPPSPLFPYTTLFRSCWTLTGLQESILITEGFDGTEPNDWPRVVEFVRLLHERGVLQRDLHPGNMQQTRSEEHTSELQSPDHLVCRLLLEKKK